MSQKIRCQCRHAASAAKKENHAEPPRSSRPSAWHTGAGELLEYLENHLWNEGKDRLKNALSPGSSPPRSPSPSYLNESMGSPPTKTVRLGKGATAFCHDFSEDEEDEEEPELHNDEARDLAALIRA